MAICAKFLGYTSSMHPLAIARSTTVLVEPLVTCIIVFYHLIQKFTPIVKDHLDLGEVFCKIKTLRGLFAIFRSQSDSKIQI